MAILGDWSQIAIAGCFAFGDDFKRGRDTSKMVDILRHTILNTLLSYKTRDGSVYGNIVLATDGRNYWRKEQFQYYEGSRKKNRDASDTDWDSIFSIAKQLRDEFLEVFPYKIVRYDRAEADDIIAVLCKWYQTNETNDTVFDASPQNVIIKSSDGDFKQLHKYQNVKQWDPLKKKLVPKPPKHFLLEKLLTGDSGDGVPNVKSADNCLVDGIRQTPISQKFKDEVFAQVESGKPIDLGNDVWNRNFQRNKLMIDFDMIPKDVEAEIIKSYQETVVKYDKGAIFNYLVKNRCSKLLSDIQRF